MTEEQARAALESWVKIHSGPARPAGIDQCQNLIAKALEKLGFETTHQTSTLRTDHRFFVSTLVGDSSRVIDFVSHSDTLEPGDSTPSPFEWKENGSIGCGPGVMDDKGGQLVALWGIQKYLSALQTAGKKRPPFTLRFLNSPNEEFGSVGFQAWLADRGRESWLVLGFEPALEDGAIIDSRRGNRWYKVQVTGREAHSGRALTHGINAGVELSKKIVALSELTSPDADVTLSLGHLKGGRPSYNTVCGHAEAWIDTRFGQVGDRDQLHKKIESILSQETTQAFTDQKSTQTQFTIEDDCPPFSRTPESEALAARYRKIVEKIEGTPIESRRSGGGADSCYLSHPGLLVLDGLGPLGTRMHSVDETVLWSSVVTRSQALCDFLLQLK
jgi:glutamate carboxypeptidase